MSGLLSRRLYVRHPVDATGRSFVISCVVALLAIAAGPVYAQQATVSGRVTDTSEAGLPGASVTITNVETGIETAVTTNQEGYYTIPLLQPGRYAIAVDLSGFRPATRTAITLAVQQVARIDFTLEVGGVEETVEVGAPLVDAQTSSLGHVIENARVRELPLNGRNPLELSRLTPGVNLLATAFLDNRNFNLTSVSMNGGQGGTNAVLIDGGSATLPARNEYAVAPNVDAVEEFRVQTNAYSAEFGMTGGGVINLVTKSGTNDFRGTLFEFLRNDKVDANSWTNNRNDLDKPPLRYNQFGGTIGGPIWLPDNLGPLSYDGHNRSFFFFNYEGIRFRSSTTALTRVPTELERRGDFSETLIQSSGGAIIPVQLYDPATTQPNPAGAGFVRDPLQAVIPSERLDPVALNALQFYPQPNRTPDDPTGRNNFISTASTFSDAEQYNARVDHLISAANRLFVRYSQNDASNSGNPPIFDADNMGDPRASFQTRNNKSVTIGDTHAFSGRVLNEVRLSVSRQALLSEPAGLNVNAPGSLGFPVSIPDTLFPRLNTGDVQNLGSDPGQFRLAGLTGGQVTDSLSIALGKHTIKTGIDLRVHQFNNRQPGPVSGQFTFSRDMTGNPQDTAGNTGFGLATFLLGSVSGGNLNSDLARAVGFQYYGAFVQDDYRISPRLTLNLGLRYDIITAPTERFDRHSNFNPTAINPVTGTPGVLEFAAVDFGRQVSDTNFTNFGPRVGLAFDVFGTGRTVVRGGYGIFYYHSGALEFPANQGFQATTPFQSEQGSDFSAFQLADGPPEIMEPSGSSLGPLSFLGNNVTYFEEDRPTPSTQQWNLSLQQELPGSTLVEVAYAGSHSTHVIGFSYDLNQLDPQFLSLGLALDDQVPNPFVGSMPEGTPLSGPTISRRQSLRPFPAYLNVNVQNPPLGDMIYHSGQVKVERRFAQGFALLGSYTFSKNIGDVGRNIIDFATTGGSPQNSVGCGQNTKFDRASCRSIEPQDVTHNFVLSTIYELPFGQGQPFLSSGGALAQILGGFQLNAIVNLRSGLPLVIRGANNGAADRPNLVGDPSLPTSEQSIDRWFNTDAFEAPPEFTFGDTPRTLPSTRGPGFASVDLSVSKNIAFTGTSRLQFRAELFNVFNRVNFNQPNSNFLSAGFGTITSAGDPRRVQFGLKLYF